MKIEGNYTFKASRELVWSLLHDPATIRQALPGCEEFDQTSPSDYIAALRVQHGPFKGRYQGQVQLLDDEQNDRLAVTVDGEGPEGTISGHGMLYLDQGDGSTTIHYAGDVDFISQTAEESPRMLRTMANALIRQFLEALDKQVRLQTGVHTTHLPGDRVRSHPIDREGTIDEKAEMKQARQTLWIVLALITFTFFSLAGLILILFFVVRWGKRIFDRRVLAAIQQEKEKAQPATPPEQEWFSPEDTV